MQVSGDVGDEEVRPEPVTLWMRSPSAVQHGSGRSDARSTRSCARLDAESFGVIVVVLGVAITLPLLRPARGGRRARRPDPDGGVADESVPQVPAADPPAREAVAEHRRRVPVRPGGGSAPVGSPGEKRR